MIMHKVYACMRSPNSQSIQNLNLHLWKVCEWLTKWKCGCGIEYGLRKVWLVYITSHLMLCYGKSEVNHHII